MSDLDLAPVAADSSVDKPPMLHAYCVGCANDVSAIAACGWVHVGPLLGACDGVRCVVCIELFNTVCPRCGFGP